MYCFLLTAQLYTIQGILIFFPRIIDHKSVGNKNKVCSLFVATGADVSRSEDDGSYDSEDGLPPLEKNLNHLNSEESEDEESDTAENGLPPLKKNLNRVNLDESEDEESCDSDSGLPPLEKNLNHITLEDSDTES